ncbi:MAG: hypothetical protein QOE11_263 [Solirubrobacteraceae bacterium]|jgi:hypothetical protein|nr:hypothetical protein [Solirubrobacteraceae bacterium]
MASVSGLSRDHRIRARDRAVAAALLALHNAPQIHYTQGPARWEGINKKLNARLGQFPRNADCSSFATWCIWNGLHVGFGLGDLVNDARWSGGYTGTMLSNGKPVEEISSVQRADCVIYGTGAPGHHTAIVVGRAEDGTPMVVSHGSEPGPFYLPYNYRGDVMGFRRYV